MIWDVSDKLNLAEQMGSYNNIIKGPTIQLYEIRYDQYRAVQFLEPNTDKNYHYNPIT